MKKHHLFGSISVLAWLLSAVAFAQAPDPIIGTWELNVAKSKFESMRAFKSETRVYELVGNEIKGRSAVVDGEGKAQQRTWTFSANYDGKERSMSGFVDGDTLSLKRVNDTTFEAVQKKAGKVTANTTRVMAKDGKSMTLTSRIHTADGKTHTDFAFFDRR